MALSEIDVAAVEQTLAECDELGRAAFLAKYGFGTATTYLLRHDGNFYDPKAVIGVAHQHTRTGSALKPNEFDATEAIARLEKLGFEVLPFSGLWWVNQGINYKIERDGGYIWAGLQTQKGLIVAHHTEMTKLRVGQRVIHYADNHIRAVSTVAAVPYTAPRPSAPATSRPGYLCPVDYQELSQPIHRNQIPDKSAEVGPFDVSGNVKQGYLYRISDDHLFPLLRFLNDRIPGFFGGTVTHQHLDPDAATPPHVPDVTQRAVLEALLTFKNVVLEGVPGTGKTYAIEGIAKAWPNRTGRPLLTFDGKPFAAIVLHPSSSYEDFVEGLRPEVETPTTSGRLFDEPVTSTNKFGLRDGFFVRVCAAAAKAPDKDVLVLLDELNRCNVPSVFGDLLLTLEASRRAIYKPAEPSRPPSAKDWTVEAPAQLPYSRRNFFVPNNVYVIATTNTTDRSVAPLDAALRRRFAFHRLEPAMPTGENLPTFLDQSIRTLYTTSGSVLRDLNDHALRPCLGPDAMLGHSYLYALREQLKDATDVETAISALKRHWRYAMLPQLIDAVRALGAEDLLDPDTRKAWLDDRAELADRAERATTALSQLDMFLQDSLELRIAVEGTGLARGARISGYHPAVHPPVTETPVTDDDATVPTSENSATQESEGSDTESPLADT
jgi:MoxR-like ATPase